MVLLPAPDGPTMATVSPGCTWKLRPCERRAVGARRDSRSDTSSKVNAPLRSAGSGFGSAGAAIVRLLGQELGHPLGRAGRLASSPHTSDSAPSAPAANTA